MDKNWLYLVSTEMYEDNDDDDDCLYANMTLIKVKFLCRRISRLRTRSKTFQEIGISSFARVIKGQNTTRAICGFAIIYTIRNLYYWYRCCSASESWSNNPNSTNWVGCVDIEPSKLWKSKLLAYGNNEGIYSGAFMSPALGWPMRETIEITSSRNTLWRWQMLLAVEPTWTFNEFILLSCMPDTVRDALIIDTAAL